MRACSLFSLFILVLCFTCSESSSVTKFQPENVTKLEQDAAVKVEVSCDIGDKEVNLHDFSIDITGEDHGRIARIDGMGDRSSVRKRIEDGRVIGEFDLTGMFLGFTHINAKYSPQSLGCSTQTLPVSVVLKKTMAATIFTSLVAVLVCIAYVMLGCALDIKTMVKTVKRPVGPLIGFISQIIVMPLTAFALGFIFRRPSEIALRLGLFVVGASPGGGASNMWTVLFGGNVDLSVTMTALSTITSFVSLPILTYIYAPMILVDSASTSGDNVNVIIPYSKLGMFSLSLIIPLLIGVAIKRFIPKVADLIVTKILKPTCFIVLLFLVIFGSYAYSYIFHFIFSDWRIVVTCAALPWLGYGCGCAIARFSGRSTEDVIAIAIETGIQNTGVSIFLLWFTFDKPLGNIAAVIPIVCALMTPIPLFLALLSKFIREKIMGYKMRGRCPVCVNLDGQHDPTQTHSDSIDIMEGEEATIDNVYEDLQHEVKCSSYPCVILRSYEKKKSGLQSAA